MESNKKAQNFSADILVVIIIVLFGALFLVINKINEEEKVDFEAISKQSTRDSQLIATELETQGILEGNNEVNVEKLLQLDEEEIKSELGIEGDFAIVFERDGKLVKIDPDNNINCVGTSNVIVNGVPCK